MNLKFGNRLRTAQQFGAKNYRLKTEILLFVISKTLTLSGLKSPHQGLSREAVVAQNKSLVMFTDTAEFTQKYDVYIYFAIAQHWQNLAFYLLTGCQHPKW